MMATGIYPEVYCIALYYSTILRTFKKTLEIYLPLLYNFLHFFFSYFVSLPN